MKVLIVGGGGREHALAWKAAQSSMVSKVFVAPGNAGTAMEAKVENLAVAPHHHEYLITFAKQNGVGLTIVGPEEPLVNGLVDRFQREKLKVFGPRSSAARLEGSKSKAKSFMNARGIPTAPSRTFMSLNEALGYMSKLGTPVVIKEDGLAAGKGVTVAQTEEEATHVIVDALGLRGSGGPIVIEKCLYGEEVSFIVVVDSKGNVLPLASSQDHKTLLDGDQGPNTGGMGAYSPVPLVSDAMQQRIMDEIIEPTVWGMNREGTPVTGFLYAGLMICKDGTPKVLEFNVRGGDPETQPIMMRLKSDFVELCLASIEGTLDQYKIEWDERPSAGVVMAADGYPNTPYTGDRISGLLDVIPDSRLFHAGTKQQGDRMVTDGGRVVCACALGDTLDDALALAYKRVGLIRWRGAQYRTDIGYRAKTY